MSSNLVHRHQPLHPADSPVAAAGSLSSRVPAAGVSAHPLIRIEISIEQTRFSTSITDESLFLLLPGQSQESAPRTPLGRRLAALSAKARNSGLASMTADEILDEVRRRRGERTD